MDPVLERLWLFVRGDLARRDFEAWICANPSVEEQLGADLYFAAISADYRSDEAVERLQDALRSFASNGEDCPIGGYPLSVAALAISGGSSLRRNGRTTSSASRD
jgi:hypothetical protein